jgi:hypothetical protein
MAVAIAVPAVWATMPTKKVEAAATSCLSGYISSFVQSAVEQVTFGVISVPSGDTGKRLSQAEQTGGSRANFIKDCIEKPLAFTLARMILDQMTEQLVTWINSGFQGSPTFVTNPGRFLLNIGDQIAGDIILGSDLAFLCSPFKIQIQLALALNYNYDSSSGAPKAACTLTGVFDNVSNAFNDFSSGGWNGWFAITQNSSNNAMGSYLKAESSISARIGNNVALETSKLQWNGGFLSYDSCTAQDGSSYTKYGPSGSVSVLGTTATVNGSPAGNGTHQLTAEEGRQVDELAKQQGITTDQARTQLAAQHSYSGDICETKTPGRLIASSLEKQMGSAVDELGVADDLDKIFNALGNQLMKQVFGGINGLLGAGTRSNPGYVGNLALKSFASTTQAKIDANNGLGGSTNPSQNTPGDGGTTGSGDPTTPGTLAGSNVAQGKYARASSVGNERGASYEPTALTDGNTRSSSGTQGKYYGGASTNASTVPSDLWFEIDLGGQTQNINKIRLFERANYDDGNVLTFGGIVYYRVVVLDRDRNIVWTSCPAVGGSIPRSCLSKQDFNIGNPSDNSHQTIKEYTVHDANGKGVNGQFIRQEAIYIDTGSNNKGRLETTEIEAYQNKAPTISLQGGAAVVVVQGAAFSDSYTAADDVDGDISNRVTKSITFGDPRTPVSIVDTTRLGTYTITYTVQDTEGAQTTVTRTVVVQSTINGNVPGYTP